MTCGSSQYDPNSAFFLRAHTDMYWVPTDTSTMKYVNQRLYINSSIDSFYFGRKTMSNSYSQISKIIYLGGTSFNFIDTNGQESIVQSGFDILVCDPNPPCGKFKRLCENSNVDYFFRDLRLL